MADRLGQEKDNKRSKTLLTVAVVLVVLNVLLFFLVPTQKNISYDVTQLFTAFRTSAMKSPAT